MIPILEPVLPVQPTVSSNALFPPLKLHYCLSSNKKFIISFAQYEMKGITHLQEAWHSTEANGFLTQHCDSDYGSDKAALADREEMKYLTA
jgi:sialic acid synthase SpsE